MREERNLAAVCQPLQSLAIAGTAKNAGKTTALNYLVKTCAAEGQVLGLTSVGRDGEAVDQITNRPKPRIRPPRGSLVATSHESALYSQATLRLLEMTPYRTALGPVGIYRVEQEGFVEVAGPVRVREAAAVLKILLDRGAEKVFLDGAADRRAFVSCGVEGFVLATGLVVAEDFAGVVEVTRSVLERLQLSAPPPEWQAACRAADGPGALLEEGFTPWLAPTFVGDLSDYARWLPADTRALYVPGALSNGLLEAILKASGAVPIVVPAGTHVLADQTLLERYFKRGGRCYALTPLRASALTINPTAPDGRTCDSAALLDLLQREFPTLPVIDVGPH
jgi:hypothetical protein